MAKLGLLHWVNGSGWAHTPQRTKIPLVGIPRSFLFQGFRVAKILNVVKRRLGFMPGGNGKSYFPVTDKV